MAGPGDDFTEFLTRPISAADRLMRAANASTDPEYLKRKAKRLMGIGQPKREEPKPLDPNDPKAFRW